MEFHPVVKGNSDATNVPCPESVLKGQHRDYYDGPNFKEYQTTFSHYQNQPLPQIPQTYHLTKEQISQFHKEGLLVIKGKDFWLPSELTLMLESVEEMGSWVDTAGKWMKYYEPSKNADPAKNGSDKILQRIENFVDYHAGMRYLLAGEKFLGIMSQLFGEQSVLYKEKINYKLPGGSGFAPHQDVAAGWWMYGQSVHISALVAIDAANTTNGALEVVRGGHNQGLLSEPWKEVESQHVDRFKWELVDTAPGDIVLFDSYVPHRSAANNSASQRRALYATYAKLSEGDWRAQYYADKRLSFPPDIERLNGKQYEYKI